VLRAIARAIRHGAGRGRGPGTDARPRPSASDLQLARYALQQLGAPSLGVRAGWDAAETPTFDERHWFAADGLSADAQLDEETRYLLRNRGRHEVQNNSWAAGMTQVLVNDEIGAGPRLRVRTGDRADNQAIESAWSRWWHAAEGPEILRLMRRAIVTDGESILRMRTSERIAGLARVGLRLEVIEADRLASPRRLGDDPDEIDGIRLRDGEPVQYEILRVHPGSDRGISSALESDLVPADSIVHLFFKLRPEQHRGSPEIAPALPIFARLRRYTLAVIANAESAAKIHAAIQTDLPPETDAEYDPMDVLDLASGQAMVLPAGYKLAQVRAEQPVTTYADFMRQGVAEAARPLGIPRNKALGDSTEANFASGKLDLRDYQKKIEVEREWIERTVLERIFEAWLQEAVLVEGLVPQAARQVGGVAHTWIWPGFDDIDREKDAKADATELANGTTSRTRIAYRNGLTLEELLDDEVRERELRADMGLEPRESQAERAASGEGDGDAA